MEMIAKYATRVLLVAVIAFCAVPSHAADCFVVGQLITTTPGFTIQFSQGDCLIDQSNRTELVFQGDSNLVVYDTKSHRALWSSKTNGKGGYGSHLDFQGDGNLVIYDVFLGPIWASNTAGQTPSELIVQTDGNVVLYNTSSGRAVWATGTNRF